MTMPSTPTRISVPLSWGDACAYQEFVFGLRHDNRYHLPQRAERFVQGLVKLAELSKSLELGSGTSFWRARLHEAGQSEPFPSSALGAPPPNHAGHGRLNPRGISYLYLASSINTAVSEVRPWLGAEATVAELATTRPLRVVNFSLLPQFVKPVDPNYAAAETTWREMVAWLFSAPFDPRDDTAYVPTQFLAERFKSSGFDGLLYGSALKQGEYNVALFDPQAARVVARSTVSVNRIEVSCTAHRLAAA